MSDTVTVACKLPHGLILRLHEMIEQNEPTAGGSFRKVKRAQVIGEPIVLKGYGRRFDRRTEQAVSAQTSSYALTYGVDADFFKKWLAQNHDLDAVTDHDRAPFSVPRKIRPNWSSRIQSAGALSSANSTSLMKAILATG